MGLRTMPPGYRLPTQAIWGSVGTKPDSAASTEPGVKFALRFRIRQYTYA